MLGGVYCHAGLFSDVNDLARLGQLLLNGGTYSGQRYLMAQLSVIGLQGHIQIQKTEGELVLTKKD